jgi:hypothetical protein
VTKATCYSIKPLSTPNEVTRAFKLNRSFCFDDECYRSVDTDTRCILKIPLPSVSNRRIIVAPRVIDKLICDPKLKVSDNCVLQ